MPQISSLDYILSKGIPVRESSIELGALSLIQEDFDREKINEIKHNIKFCKLTVWDIDPIFISHNADPIVVDGNHRYIAYLELFGPETVVPCLVIELTFAQALSRLNMISEAYNPLSERITRSEFRYIESKLDDLFEILGMDVAFTKHFKERMNQRSISVSDMVAAMRSLFQRFGERMTKWKDGTSRVLRSLSTDLNIPFVLYRNSDGIIDVVLKTVMKKRNFLTNEPFVNVESVNSEAFDGIITEFNDFLTNLNVSCEYLIEEGRSVALFENGGLMMDILTGFVSNYTVSEQTESGVIIKDKQGEQWRVNIGPNYIQLAHETSAVDPNSA